MILNAGGIMKSQVTSVLGAIFFILCSTSDAYHGWRPRQEYVFTLDGRTVAGIPSLGQQQHSGIHYKGILKVQRDNANLLLMKFQNMTYTKLHENLPGGWWTETRNTHEVFRELPLTPSTISVKLSRNSSVTVKSTLVEWEVNFIQGVVSQLQLNIKTPSAVHKDKNSRLNAAYTMIESSPFGSCEVQYEVTRVPKSIVLSHPEWFPRMDLCGSRTFIEVTKTRNFSNCINATEFHFGMPRSKMCTPGGSECDNFWSRASVTRATGCGDKNDFMLLQSEINSRVMVNLHLHNGTQASVSSYLTINLKSAKPLTRRFTTPNEALVIIPNFKYRYTQINMLKDPCPTSATSDSNEGESSDEEDIGLYQSHNQKHQERNVTLDAKNIITTPRPEAIPTVDPSNEWSQSDSRLPPFQPLNSYVLGLRDYEGSYSQIQKLKELIADIASDFEIPKVISEKITLEKVMFAVRICRTMTLNDLMKTVGNMALQARNNKLLISERKLFRDVLVMCGTNPAFQILKSSIERRELKGEEGSEVVAALPSHLLTPTQDIVHKFYELTRSAPIREDQQLKITTTLAFSNLLRIACVDKRTRSFQYTVKMLGTHCELDDAVRYLPWFTSQLKADASLKRIYIAALGNTGTLEALQHLKAVAEDGTISPYLRATAIYSMKYQVLNYPEETSKTLFALFYDLSQPVYVRVAAVSMLFYTRPDLTMLQRIAVSSWYDPSVIVAAFVRSSLLSLAKIKDPVYATLSRNAGISLPLSRPISMELYKPHNFLWTKVNGDLQEVIFHQISHETSFETTTFYYRFTQRLGGFSRVGLEAEMITTSPDYLLAMIQEFIYPSDDTTQVRPAIKNLSRSTRWIRETLGITERTVPKLEGEFHIILDRLTERIFPFDKKMYVDFVRDGRRLVDQMRNGKDFHFQKVKLKSVRMEVITELGFPVNFELSVPWAVRCTGNVYFDLQENMLQMDIDLMYTSQMISELGFFTAWDETVHMAASHGISLIQFPPMQIKGQLIKPRNAVSLLLKMLKPEDDIVIIHHTSKPFTSQHDVFDLTPATLKKTASIIHTRRETQKRKSIIPNINISYTTEAANRSPITWLENAVNVNGFLMMWPSLEASSFEMELDKFGDISLDADLNFATIVENVINISSAVSRRDTLQSETTMDTAWLSERTEDIILSQFSSMTAEQYTRDVETNTTNNTQSTDYNVTKETTVTPASTLVETTVTQASNGNGTVNETVNEEGKSEQNAGVIEEAHNGTNESLISEVPVPVINQENGFSLGDFNVTNIDPFLREINGSHHKYLLVQMFSGIENGRAYIVGVNISIHGSQLRKYSAFWSHVKGNNRKYCRHGLFFKKEGSEHQFAMTSSLVSLVAPMMKLANSIRANVTSFLITDFIYRRNNSEYQLSVKTVMDRSTMKAEELKASPLKGICIDRNEGPKTDVNPKCIKAALNAMFLDRYNMTLTYNEECKEFGPTVKGYLNYFRYLLFPYITEDNEDSSTQYAPANTIKGVLELSPSLNTINVWIRAPNLETEFTGIPVNPLITSNLRFNPAVSYARRFTGESHCGYGDNKFITFDGVEFDYNKTTTCWHVLTKDCSGMSRIVILARSSDNEKEVEVNLDNYKIVNLSPGLKISVNGESLEIPHNTVTEIEDEAGTILLKLESSKDPEQIIIVDMPAHGFRIMYTGSSVVISTVGKTRGRLCGICGDNDGDIINEFKSPRLSLSRHGGEYAYSYALNDNKCLIK